MPVIVVITDPILIFQSCFLCNGNFHWHLFHDFSPVVICLHHYTDVIMSAIASQITSLIIVYSTVYSGADQRKHQSSASLAFVWGIHRSPVNSPHKWPVMRGKCFHLMTSSCKRHNKNMAKLYENKSLKACHIYIYIYSCTVPFTPRCGTCG